MTSPIILEFGHSRWLAAYVIVVHSALLAAISILAVAYPIFGLFLVLPLFSLRRSWSGTVSRAAQTAIARLVCCSDSKWTLFLVSGEQQSASLIPHCFVSPWIVILSFSMAGSGIRHVIITIDNADPEQVRRLRAYLRIHQNQGY